MKDKFKFAFDDEPVNKFCYDIKNKKIQLYFSGYYDIGNETKYVEKPCVFEIRNWSEGNSIIGDELRKYDLNTHIGVISMILYMKYADEKLEIFVSTVDDRYLTLSFKTPDLVLSEREV